jgi:hypothetical protein
VPTLCTALGPQPKLQIVLNKMALFEPGRPVPPTETLKRADQHEPSLRMCSRSTSPLSVDGADVDCVLALWLIAILPSGRAACCGTRPLYLLRNDDGVAAALAPGERVDGAPAHLGNPRLFICLESVQF